MFTCHICGEEEGEPGQGMALDMEQAVVHLRLFHPDQYEEPERWPDGSLVVEDTTLEPGDFDGR